MFLGIQYGPCLLLRNTYGTFVVILETDKPYPYSLLLYGREWPEYSSKKSHLRFELIMTAFLCFGKLFLQVVLTSLSPLL